MGGWFRVSLILFIGILSIAVHTVFYSTVFSSNAARSFDLKAAPTSKPLRILFPLPSIGFDPTEGFFSFSFSFSFLFLFLGDGRVGECVIWWGEGRGRGVGVPETVHCEPWDPLSRTPQLSGWWHCQPRPLREVLSLSLSHSLSLLFSSTPFLFLSTEKLPLTQFFSGSKSYLSLWKFFCQITANWLWKERII